MNRFDIVNDAVIDSPPDRVWDALIAEFQGAGRWWTPANTFRATGGSPDRPGGTVEVTVHPKGADKGGPKLKFIARTRTVEPGRLLHADYVGGGFSGTSTYRLRPLEAGRTALSMRFHAEPRGPVRLLARLADVGQEHLKATRAAFQRLDALLRESATGAPAELQARTDDGARLAITRHTPSTRTDVPTVVLAHGWGAGRPVWDAVVCRLVEQGFPVVTFDQRGHGDSTAGTEPFTVERAGRDLAAVVEASGAGEVIVAGHSGGGFGALAYAVADAGAVDGRLRGLVLLGTAAHEQYVGDGEAKMMGNPVFSWALRRGPVGRRMLRHTMGAAVTAADLEANRTMFAATPRAVREAAFRASKDMDLRAGLAAVTVPAVVLSGAADKVVKPELGAAIAAAMPLARYELLPTVGHMLPLEVPALVARTVAELYAPVYGMR